MSLIDQLKPDIKSMLNLSRQIGEWEERLTMSARVDIKGYDPKRFGLIETKLTELRDQLKAYENKWLND